MRRGLSWKRGEPLGILYYVSEGKADFLALQGSVQQLHINSERVVESNPMNLPVRTTRQTKAGTYRRIV